MESFKIENLSFTYSGNNEKVLENINIAINQGEFVTICGKSGCGKTTLLRLLKPSLAPFGNLEGRIYFEGRTLEEADTKEQAARIGFVMQNPDNQLVTDKVWHELAFGLESLGYRTVEIRARVAEMASFFGIESWFYKNVTELSGGQKQLLNLASVMAMSPSVLILDEPTSQLDPICAQEFLRTLEKINRELGTTIILTEHRLEEAFPISDRVVVMENGRIIADDEPCRVGEILKSTNHDMYPALPAPMRIYGVVDSDFDCPLTVREGRVWLEKYSEIYSLNADLIPTQDVDNSQKAVAVELKDVWFRYERSLPDVIKGLNVQVSQGEIFAIVGGNGTGKTTALSLISGVNKPCRGEVFLNGKSVSKTENLYNGILGVLPQNPQAIFAKKTVRQELLEMLPERGLPEPERVQNISSLCRIENLQKRHPYDLSGGEQQRVALAKVLLRAPEILLLDEPTKGMDAHFKEEFAEILQDLKARGVTIIMVSHDIEFCAKYTDRCAMFFDGNIVSIGHPREFFAGKNFYTTSANRMARTRLPQAVLDEDIIRACGGRINKKETRISTRFIYKNEDKAEKDTKEEMKKPNPVRVVFGCIFALLFVITSVLYLAEISSLLPGVLQLIGILELAAALVCFFPGGELEFEREQPKREQRLTRHTLVSALIILILVPLTIYLGTHFFGSRKYYLIGILIMAETLIPFFMLFEKRKPQARELVVISVLCALAVAGRTALFMLPQFKPVIAIVIISAICFGGETGFLVGAITGFVSNFFLGQGPWTPWQMFAFGIIGFVAGVLFGKSFLRKTRASICIFGAFSTLVIYGGIINPASIIMWQEKITAEMILSAYIYGMPFDAVHASATAFFLWMLAGPMICKLERIKVKYGLIER